VDNPDKGFCGPPGTRTLNLWISRQRIPRNPDSSLRWSYSPPGIDSETRGIPTKTVRKPSLPKIDFGAVCGLAVVLAAFVVGTLQRIRDRWSR
jgi:hypothetical protein